uniref:G-protein coupled receptors family 1 profile domain-containing protein n=1 Tax=Ciona intestinalis TaxID=7719 RepID=F7AM41_CIOIN
NRYILQLAIADTLFLLMLPFTASSELSGEWSYGIVMCKIKEAILFINYYASIYFLVIMSFDRYLAVTKAFSSSDLVVALRGPRAAGIITAIGWVISVGISSPLFIYSTVGKCNVAFTYIITHSPNQYYFTWLKVNVSLFFCFPLLAMCCFYGLIIRAIVTTQAGAGRNEVQKYRNRVTVIVLALICLFLVSWLPWYTVQLALMNGISLSNSECKRLTYAVRLIAYLNSTLNPYFYGTLGGRFAERLRKARSKLGFVYTLSITSDTRRRARSWNNSARMANGLKDQDAPSGRLHIVENGKLSMGQRTERTAV